MTTENAVAVVKPEESLSLQKVAEGLFASGLFPNTKNKYGAFSIVQYGRELGIPPMMALRNINIISGQLACNAQLMLTLAMQKGVTYDVELESDKGVTINFKRGASSYKASFMEADAKAANLLGKDNWKKYPRDMYFWRAVAKGVRRIAPDAVMGLYTAEEVTEGAAISVSEVPPAKQVAPAATPAEPETVDATIEESFLTPEEQERNAAPDEPLAVGTELRTKIDGMIQDEGIDAKEFKEWLFLAKKIGKKFGHPSLSSMSIKDAEGLIAKWKETMGKFNLWVDKKNEAA